VQEATALVHWMMFEFALGWYLAETQETDDKVGNGFTLVIRKVATRKLLG